MISKESAAVDGEAVDMAFNISANLWLLLSLMRLTMIKGASLGTHGNTEYENNLV